MTPLQITICDTIRKKSMTKWSNYCSCQNSMPTIKAQQNGQTTIAMGMSNVKKIIINKNNECTS